MNNEDWYLQMLNHLDQFKQKMPEEFNQLLFQKLTVPVHYKEDTLILRPKDVAKWIFWPIKGYIRIYKEYYPVNDSVLLRQKTVGISVPGKICLLSKSFLTQSECGYFAEITKGSVLAGISYENFKKLGEEVFNFQQLTIQMTALREENRVIEKNLSMIDRATAYFDFLAHFGLEVESYIFQMHIASFIGMSPETLSRIRKECGYSNAKFRK